MKSGRDDILIGSGAVAPRAGRRGGRGFARSADAGGSAQGSRTSKTGGADSRSATGVATDDGLSVLSSLYRASVKREGRPPRPAHPLLSGLSSVMTTDNSEGDTDIPA